MDCKLIIPRRRTEKPSAEERLYFLGGPVRGADDWQRKAIRMLAEKDSGCHIAVPVRYAKNDQLSEYFLFEEQDWTGKGSFPDQTMWEREYLESAAHLGCIIFWLPCESKENPRKKEDGPYARDTYGELGRWSVRSAFKINLPRVNLVVGAEKEFPGLSVIRKNFNADHKREFHFCETLEEIIESAIALAKKKDL